MRPTYDSIYLASRINETWDSTSLSGAGLQRLGDIYGVREVEDALRMMHGFPPKDLRKPFAYLRAILESSD